MLAIGFTDILFALDSIPAIYGLTQDPYIVFTANAFALMGLRQLYFLIGGLLKKLVHLSYGLSVILGFIGVKLVLHALPRVGRGRCRDRHPVLAGVHRAGPRGHHGEQPAGPRGGRSGPDTRSTRSWAAEQPGRPAAERASREWACRATAPGCRGGRRRGPGANRRRTGSTACRPPRWGGRTAPRRAWHRRATRSGASDADRAGHGDSSRQWYVGMLVWAPVPPWRTRRVRPRIRSRPGLRLRTPP
ncbi:hypothetical protein STENM36S_07935 [Streptomyces tendae]